MHGGMLVYSAKIGTCLGIRLVSMCSCATIIDVTIPYFRKKFEIVFFFNVKNNGIFPCLHNIRLSYNTYKCFSALSIILRTSTLNSKHGSFLC